MNKSTILQKFETLNTFHHRHVQVGDWIELGLIIKENKKFRIQKYKGFIISKKGKGFHQTIRVRKMFQKIGVEQVFPVYSPQIEFIKSVKSNIIKKSKLYYLRHKIGKTLFNTNIPK